MQSVDSNLVFGPDITWPKEFPELKAIDDSLRCGICYDYLKTAMVTACAHSYCSICIRKYLSYKTACPTCFEETFETSLRNNRILDRVVELFSQIRDKLIKHLKIAAIHFNCNEKSVSSSTSGPTSQKTPLPNETPKNNKKIVSKAISSKGKLNFSSLSSPSTSTNSTYRKSEISKRLEDILGSPVTNGGVSLNDVDPVSPASVSADSIPTVPSMFLMDPLPTQNQPRPDMPLVSCPVCFVDIPERNINAHLDNCLSNVDKPVKSPVKKKLKRNPLPKMVWHMMAEKELRKKLKEFGLNTQGDKKALISRIQRYIVLYNSECDSENPRSVTDIIRQVERDEKQSNSLQRMIVKKNDPKLVEEENKKYIKENKDSFKKLIEAMKEREGRNIKPLRPINRLSSDEENTTDQQSAEAMASCSKNLQETVNLCESRSSSPILGSRISADGPVNNGLTSNSPEEDGEVSQNCSSEDIFLHQTSCKPATSNNNQTLGDSISGIEGKSFANNFCDAEDLFRSSPSSPPSPSCVTIAQSTHKSETPNNQNCSNIEVQDEFCDAEVLFHSSPTRPPSPSCIITAHSDSDSQDSISILINKNSDEELTENANPGTSQLCDPDFVLDTEDQAPEECSDEVFVPKRKSKRKHEKSVSNPIPSPRRTRRCLKKQ